MLIKLFIIILGFGRTSTYPPSSDLMTKNGDSFGQSQGADLIATKIQETVPWSPTGD